MKIGVPTNKAESLENAFLAIGITPQVIHELNGETSTIVVPNHTTAEQIELASTLVGGKVYQQPVRSARRQITAALSA